MLGWDESVMGTVTRNHSIYCTRAVWDPRRVKVIRGSVFRKIPSLRQTGCLLPVRLPVGHMPESRFSVYVGLGARVRYGAGQTIGVSGTPAFGLSMGALCGASCWVKGERKVQQGKSKTKQADGEPMTFHPILHLCKINHHWAGLF